VPPASVWLKLPSPVSDMTDDDMLTISDDDDLHDHYYDDGDNDTDAAPAVLYMLPPPNSVFYKYAANLTDATDPNKDVMMTTVTAATTMLEAHDNDNKEAAGNDAHGDEDKDNDFEEAYWGSQFVNIDEHHVCTFTTDAVDNHDDDDNAFDNAAPVNEGDVPNSLFHEPPPHVHPGSAWHKTPSPIIDMTDDDTLAISDDDDVVPLTDAADYVMIKDDSEDGDDFKTHVDDDDNVVPLMDAADDLMIKDDSDDGDDCKAHVDDDDDHNVQAAAADNVMKNDDDEDVMMRTVDDVDIMLKAAISYFQEYDFGTDFAFAANPDNDNDITMKPATRDTQTNMTDIKIITTDTNTTTGNNATSDRAADKPFRPPPKPPHSAYIAADHHHDDNGTDDDIANDDDDPGHDDDDPNDDDQERNDDDDDTAADNDVDNDADNKDLDDDHDHEHVFFTCPAEEVYCHLFTFFLHGYPCVAPCLQIPPEPPPLSQPLHNGATYYLSPLHNRVPMSLSIDLTC